MGFIIIVIFRTENTNYEYNIAMVVFFLSGHKGHKGAQRTQKKPLYA
jgi:hypothetical protein